MLSPDCMTQCQGAGGHTGTGQVSNVWMADCHTWMRKQLSRFRNFLISLWPHERECASRSQKSVSSMPHVRTEFNLWPVLGEEQSQQNGRAVEVSVACSGPCRRGRISEIGVGYRIGLRLLE